MLQPLAIAVMGALAMSVLFALVATPVVYFLLVRVFGRATSVLAGAAGESGAAAS